MKVRPYFTGPFWLTSVGGPMVRTTTIIIIIIIIKIIIIIISPRPGNIYWVDVQQGIVSSHGERDPL